MLHYYKSNVKAHAILVLLQLPDSKVPRKVRFGKYQQKITFICHLAWKTGISRVKEFQKRTEADRNGFPSYLKASKEEPYLPSFSEPQ